MHSVFVRLDYDLIILANYLNTFSKICISTAYSLQITLRNAVTEFICKRDHIVITVPEVTAIGTIVLDGKAWFSKSFRYSLEGGASSEHLFGVSNNGSVFLKTKLNKTVSKQVCMLFRLGIKRECSFCLKTNFQSSFFVRLSQVETDGR